MPGWIVSYIAILDGHRGYSENAALLITAVGSLSTGDRSVPSKSGGGGKPATDAIVGYKSTDSTKDVLTPGDIPGTEMMRGTRVPSSKFVCFPQTLCSP